MMMNTVRKNDLLRFSVVTLLFAFSTSCASIGRWDRDEHRNHEHKCGHVKNIVVMIPDGCDASIQTLTRWFAKDRYDYDLILDKMLSGGMKTSMANSVITGSAAAASAFSSGNKTTARFLSVGPRENDLLEGFETIVHPFVPFATVLEANKLKGKSVGLVATSRISHATPAAYASHIQDRGWDNDILEHLVYQDLDVVFGGGVRHLIPKPSGKRTDGENLKDVLLARGVNYVTDKTGMENLSSTPAWGMFAASHMAADIDNRYFGLQQPTLEEMTAKAIELLSRNEKGFFLMVEASQVDWAGHANDPIHMVTDFLAFDKAVKVAVDFAEKDKNTLVVAFPDHNTGGLTLGNYITHFQRGYGYPLSSDNRAHYTDTTVADLLSPLAGMRMTANAMSKLIQEEIDNAPGECDENCVEKKIRQGVATHWGIDITLEEAEQIRRLKDVQTGRNNKMGLAFAIAEIVSRNHTLFGWTTHGHAGEDVPLWTYGKNRLIGLHDNTEIAKEIACRSESDLADVSARLFVPVSTVFTNAVTDTSDPENLVLKIGDAELYEGKDLLNIDESTYNLKGIVVYAPATKNWFIPEEAVKLINERADL
jgi:alkaline phosphatase